VDELFRWIINAPIALLTLTPLKPMARPAKPEIKTPALAPLPATPGATRAQAEHIFWQLMQDKMPEPGGRPDIVDCDLQDTQPIRGRHARPDNDERGPLGTDARLPEMSGSA
jgi:hypothetical protein